MSNRLAYGPDWLDQAPAPTAEADWLDQDPVTDDHASLCEAYPYECDWSDELTTPDPWGPTAPVCLTHDTEGKCA